MYGSNDQAQRNRYGYRQQQHAPDISDNMEPDYDQRSVEQMRQQHQAYDHGRYFDDIRLDYHDGWQEKEFHQHANSVEEMRSGFDDRFRDHLRNGHQAYDQRYDFDNIRPDYEGKIVDGRRPRNTHAGHKAYQNNGYQPDDRYTERQNVFQHNFDKMPSHHSQLMDEYTEREAPGSIQRDDDRFYHMGGYRNRFNDNSVGSGFQKYVQMNNFDKEFNDASTGRQGGNGMNQDIDINEVDSSDTSSLYTRGRQSIRRRGTHRSRRQRNIPQTQVTDDQRKSFADGMKTLVRRRQTLKSRSEANSRKSRHDASGGIIHNMDTDEIYADINDIWTNEHLPSTKLPKTMSLKERLCTLQKYDGHMTTAQRATLLRDHILTKEPSRLKGLALKRYQISMGWQRFKNWFKNKVYQLELWSGAFKVIEGQFGTATMSYFRFLRWMMFLNLFMTIFMLGIVFLPFLLIQPSTRFENSVEACQSIFHYRAYFLTNNYTETTSSTTTSESVGQNIVDVLQGTGWLENTELFYGCYHNKTSTLFTGSKFVYDMGLAYLFAIGLSFMLSFILLVKNSAKGFKQRVLLSSSGGMTLYCNKLFGAWDYCISQQKTAHLKHTNILQDLMNELEYQRLQWKKESRTRKEKAKLYSIRAVINLLVIAILGSSLYLIYFTNTRLIELTTQQRNRVLQLILEYLPSIVIMLLGVLVPMIFNKVVEAEDYMPAFRIRITLIRTVLLRLASLGMLMISLYTGLTSGRTHKQIDIPCVNVSTQNNSGDAASSPNNTDDSATNEMEDIPCWENYVGQQIYKLVILNFLVVISVTFLWEFPRKLMYKRLHTKVKAINLLGQQQFDLTKNVLDLIYLQTLCWLGMSFSPLIPAMCFVKCFLFFYVKKTSLLHNCLPMQQYGTSKSSSLFMTVLLLSFGLSAIPIGVVIGIIQPSEACGPFRVYSSEGYIMFDVITNLVNSWTKVKMVFHLIGTGGFMVVLGVLLCCLMTYYYIVGQAHYKMSEALREQLKVEGQDKQFLLARVNEVLALEDVEEEDQDEGEDRPGATGTSIINNVL